jgi:3-deoxy-D-manno-octulosonic-acid transferase
LRQLYTLFYILLLPLFVARLFWRSRKAPDYRRRIAERFALVPRRTSGNSLIWVHAVSVGEVIAATPMIQRLMEKYPNHEFCVTTTTPTGSDRVRAAFEGKVYHYYLPYDVPSLIWLFTRAIRPDLLIIMETELWPNLLAMCRRRQIPIVLANARLSKKSAKGYGKIRPLVSAMFQRVTLIAAQSKMDAERMIFLGAERQKVHVTGSIKYDIDIHGGVHQRALVLKAQLNAEGRKVVIFASTHPGEDELILPLVKRLYQIHPEFLAIIAPRHPERFEVVAEMAEKFGISLIRLSKKHRTTEDTQLVLVDTMGEMLSLYGLVDVAFLGGSLIRHGGHNFLEAAAWSIPIFTGPHVYNFQTVANTMIKAGGLKRVHDHFELERSLQYWLNGTLDLTSVGAAAKKVQRDNQGALERLIRHISQVMEIR